MAPGLWVAPQSRQARLAKSYSPRAPKGPHGSRSPVPASPSFHAWPGATFPESLSDRHGSQQLRAFNCIPTYTPLVPCSRGMYCGRGSVGRPHLPSQRPGPGREAVLALGSPPPTEKRCQWCLHSPRLRAQPLRCLTAAPGGAELLVTPSFASFGGRKVGGCSCRGGSVAPHGWVAAASVGSGSWKGPQGLGVDSWVGSGRGSIVDGCRPGSLHGGDLGRAGATERVGESCPGSAPLLRGPPARVFPFLQPRCTLHEREKAIFPLAQLASMAPFPCS